MNEFCYDNKITTKKQIWQMLHKYAHHNKIKWSQLK